MIKQKKILYFLVFNLNFYPGPEHHREAAVPDRDPLDEPPGQAVIIPRDLAVLRLHKFHQLPCSQHVRLVSGGVYQKGLLFFPQRADPPPALSLPGSRCRSSFSALCSRISTQWTGIRCCSISPCGRCPRSARRKRCRKERICCCTRVCCF